MSIRKVSIMPMHNPSHPGELIRDCLEAKGWTVSECAAQLGVARHTLSRLLNGPAGISPAMAISLERLGWSDAEHWSEDADELRPSTRTPPPFGIRLVHRSVVCSCVCRMYIPHAVIPSLPSAPLNYLGVFE